ncbi:MAG: hypothetical protein OXH96_08760 [Spirochaetaceae bacterium]|nr:hypothetical protein [Spirochaetaceae bacterium]
MAEPIITAGVPPAERREPEALEFPGCRPVRVARDEIADCEQRFEYWSADTEVAMVCEPVSYYHERPAHRLARLADRIAAARGAPIEAVGHTDLLVRNARGERQRIMQADQILFLHPAQTIPRGNVIEVGTDALPEVVLEVDHTTDVRRGKLGRYEAWGFGEVWVEVPEEPAPSRPAALGPGLTIYARERAGLRPAPASRAFPGWTAAEIHRALNEPELSEETAGVLNRVGRRLGAAEGTGPDSDPFLRRQRRESHTAGWAAGHAEGRADAQRASALQVLKSRGVAVSASLSVRLAELEQVSEHLVAAALECRDEEHFVQLLLAPER